MDLREHAPGCDVTMAPVSSMRRDAAKHIADLQAKLAISEAQMAAWELFAESLRANRRRMQTFVEETEQPFGALEDRLAARDAMRHAAADLFAVLDRAQRQTAMRLLPLCCWPPASLEAVANGRAQSAVSITDLIAELKRNATYYSAGPDREAGDLLWQAASALAQL